MMKRTSCLWHDIDGNDGKADAYGMFTGCRALLMLAASMPAPSATRTASKTLGTPEIEHIIGDLVLTFGHSSFQVRAY